MTAAAAPTPAPATPGATAFGIANGNWESRTVDLGGGPIHYADFGGAGPVMVLVHGIASSHLNWMGIGPRLAENHRVYAVDLPGYGLSELRDPATVHNSQKYLDRFIDHVSGGEKVIVFGHSMGGLVSLLEVAAHPEKVSELILMAPAAPFPRRAVIGPLLFPVLFALLAPKRSAAIMRRTGGRLPTDRVVRETLKRISAPTSTLPEDIVQAHVDLVSHQRERYDWVERALIESAASITRTTTRRRQYRRMLQDLRVPTLLMHGTRDKLVPYKAGIWLHRMRPDWSWRPLYGIGHMVQMEDEDQVLTIVKEWEMAQKFMGTTA
ncbi:MAG: alpha/beta fold hydrolase [Candidatus Dormibacteria bacterium]